MALPAPLPALPSTTRRRHPRPAACSPVPVGGASSCADPRGAGRVLAAAEKAGP